MIGRFVDHELGVEALVNGSGNYNCSKVELAALESVSVFCCVPLCGGKDISNKLRPAFVAEFLKDSSPDRLCILNSPTCVGLRYG